MSTSLMSSCLSVASKNQKHGHLLYFCVRVFSKKYPYNLDNLIEWKKSTNLAFGNPRKYTKNGKLRKSKNDDNEQLKRTLESMSAQSSYFNNMNFGGTEFADIPYLSYQNSDVDNLQIHYEQHLSSDSRNDMYRHSVHENFQEITMNETNFQLPKMSVNKKTTPKRSNSTKVDMVSSIIVDKNDGIKNEDAINIPVIAPIPYGDGDKSVLSSKNEKIDKSNWRQVKPRELPSEPPLSFSLINQVPLVLKDHFGNDEFSAKILQFKEDVASLSLKTIPSVKTILSRTMPDLNRFFLNRWREKMIQELGEEGFKAHQDANIKRGVNFHANVMELLSGKSPTDIQIMPDNEGHWASLQTAMKHVSGVQALEDDLKHSILMYRGVLDCVAKYKDVLCVIDWKTSKKPRPLLKNTYDDPVQVAAYIGLVNDSKDNLMKFGEVNHGLLVILYPDGSPAHIHLMNKTLCEQYWDDWCERLHFFYQLTYTAKFGST